MKKVILQASRERIGPGSVGYLYTKVTQKFQVDCV